MIRLIAIVFFLLIAPPAFGAVAHDSSGTGATGVGTTLTYDHTVTGSNTSIICTATYAPGGSFYSVSSVAYNGVGLALVTSQTSSATNAVVEMWFLYIGGADGNPHTAEVDFTGTVAAAFDCTSFTGTSNTLGAATTTNDIVTGQSCTVPANGLCYDVAYNNQGATGCQTRTPGGSATKRYDICANNGPGDSIESFSSTISATATMTWDHDSDAYEGQIVVPISPAAAVAAVRKRRPMTFQ